MAVEGARRLMDYQDAAYAHMYLDRLSALHKLDDGRDGWALTREAARYLALWMSYEDTIRVADLKVRAQRMQRVRTHVKASAGEIVRVTEFLHPRFPEVCDTLPRSLGRRMRDSAFAKRLLGPLFAKGRFIETTGFAGFAMLSLLASLRRWRRSTLRYAEEDARIEAWLELVREAARIDSEAAVEIIRCQRLIKGYGETYERGLSAFHETIATYTRAASKPDAASVLRAAREAALASKH
jgi:indolepyruvate ferredoxin oxidoreductase beta subunit